MMIKITKEQKRMIKREAQLELARQHYKYYLQLAHNGNYKLLPHNELIANELQKIIDGEQKHIMIEIGPRHGKSMTVSETFQSYYLAKNPDKRVITSAYSDSLARKFGRLNRNKFIEYANELFGITLSDNNSAVNNWGISKHTGGMISTGIGGSITGEGADLMIIDDPVKNRQEAESSTYRNRVWEEWESTLSTRLHKGASVIVIMTRWHEDDLIGRMLESSPYNWTRLRLPTIAEDENDLLGREIGEALAPELGFDEEWAKNKRIEVGERTWASLYQQRPAPATGAIFKRDWILKVDAPPIHYDDILISWDFAFKGTNESDYVDGQVWIKKGADFYMIDHIRKRMDFSESLKAVQRLKDKYPYCHKILIEDKANGPAIINILKRKISGIIPITPRESKEARAHAVTPFFEAGNVHYVKTVPQLDEHIEELVSFPNAQNDDSIDSMTQALNYFARKPTASVSSINAW